MNRLAVLALIMLCGVWHAGARAADLVRIELSGGQVVHGRLVGNTARDLLIEVTPNRPPVNVPRSEIRRFAVVAPERLPVAAPAPLLAPGPRAERLPLGERAGTLRVSGANSIGAQLMPSLLLDYGQDAGLIGAQEEMTTDPAARVFLMQGAEATRRLRVQVVSHGSANAFVELVNNQADIGMSTRRANDAELRALQSAPANAQRVDTEQVIGLSGVVFIVHRDNPLRSISLAHLRDLLTGAATRWPATGGLGLPVTVYGLDRRSGDYDVVQDRVLGPGVRLAPQAKLFESHEDIADAVAADPAAIGFVGAAYIRNARALRLDQDCGPGGDPSVFNIKTEEYPLSRRLYLYTSSRASPLARDLLSYIASERGQGVLDKAGFVNLDPVLASATESAAQLDAAGRALPEEARTQAGPLIEALKQTLAGARRLSITFRFENGRSDLDARAEADLDRLLQWTRRPGAPNTPVILVGHASPDGAFASNLELSRARAQAVAARLQQMGVTVSQVEAMGPADQVVCGKSMAENEMNRRVEVWVR